MNIESLMYVLNLLLFWAGIVSYVWVVWDTTKHKIGYHWLVGMLLLWLVVLPIYLVKRKKLLAAAQEEPTEHSTVAKVLAWLSVVVWLFWLSFSYSDSTHFMSCEEAAPVAQELAVSDIADWYEVVESDVTVRFEKVALEYTSETERRCKAEVYYSVAGNNVEAEMIRFRIYFEKDEQWIQLI